MEPTRRSPPGGDHWRHAAHDAARLERDGYSGLRDGRKGKPSFGRAPLATCRQVLWLYQETYFDFNVRHFHGKLGSEHGIELRSKR